MNYLLISFCSASDGQKYWQHPVKSQEVEIAGYVLLTYAKQRDQNGGLPILRWLVSQRTPYGGFQSTQVNKWKIKIERKISDRNMNQVLAAH